MRSYHSFSAFCSRFLQIITDEGLPVSRLWSVQCLILGSVQVTWLILHLCFSPGCEIHNYAKIYLWVLLGTKTGGIGKMCFFICLNFHLSGTLNKKWLLPPHKILKEVKIGYINIVDLFVAAPQFIQPSVAIETGLVFLSALQLEEKKKLKIFMGVPRCVH